MAIIVSDSAAEETLQAYTNPLSIQAKALDDLSNRVLDGNVVSDGNNPFTFLTEFSANMTAHLVNKACDCFNHLYPENAQTATELYKHLSDFDYIGLYSTPATTTVEIVFDRKFLIDHAINVTQDINDEASKMSGVYSKIIIPQYSKCTIGDRIFGLMYPIEIRVRKAIKENKIDYANSVITVAWDTTYKNPLMSLNSYILEHRDFVRDSQSLTANGEEIGLFPQNYNSSPMRIYDTQIIKNDILVADFVPVKDENDVGYMYDKITHRLFANAGTGSFVLGSEVEQYNNTSKIAFVEEYKGKLPRKYTEVEYLESTGTQYIATGMLSTANSKVDITYSFSSMESGVPNNCAIFGGRNDTTKNTFTFFKIASGNPQYFRFDYNQQQTVGTVDNLTWNNTSKYRFVYNGTTATTSNITTGESTSLDINPGSTFTSSPIIVFGVNTSNHSELFMKGRIYKYWYTDGTTTIDLIPVLDETGKPCMYDRVSGNVYYNQGTGDDFIAGPKIRQVEYLESTGTQYINTGYAFTDDFSWEIDFENITRGTTLFGGRTSSVRTALLYQKTTTQGIETTCPIDNMTGDQTPFQLTDLSSNRHKVKMSVASNKGSVWVDGTQVYNEQAFTGAYISGTTQALFADNFGTSISEYTSSKVYGLKMWQGSSLVRDFIPVIDENNIGYMFDRVNHTLYTNAGTGSFAYGNLVRQYTLRLFRERDDIPTTYKKVSYLQSTGTQYIDTGLKGKNGYDFDFKFNSKIDSTAYGIGGEWQSGNSCYLGVIRNNNKFAYHYKSTQSPVEIQTLVNNTDYEVQAHLYSSEQYYVINGTKSTVGIISGDFTSTENIWLFAINASTVTYSNLKMYYMKIWDNGTLTRDFVPVIRKSDNKPGMWDKVTRTFYTNAGSGEFNYGE